MAEFPSAELLIGIAAVVVAAVSIFLFLRASRSKTRTEPQAVQPTIEARTASEEMPLEQTTPTTQERELPIPRIGRHLPQPEVERARSNIRVLTLKRELLSMVLKRLFEAEDEGEISRDERTRLSRDYEDDMKRIGEDLKRSELMVTLNELETIRDEILKKFEATLSSTQSKIDTILKELKIEEAEKPPAELPRKRRPAKKEEEAERAEEIEEGAEEEKPQPEKRKSEVEEKLEQLRKEVLKELEELDKLEIGV